MAIETLPKIGRNDTFEQVRESLGAALDTLEFLFNGGLDSLNIRRLTADKITTGTLDAGKVTVRANLNGGAYIEIDGTGMTVSDGSQTTLRIDTDGNITMIGTLNASSINGSVITGSLVQTAESGIYPRIELSSSGNLLAAYGDSDSYVGITPAQSGEPAMVFIDAVLRALITYTGSVFFVGSSTGIPMSISSGGQLDINANGPLRVDGLAGYTGSFSVGTQTVSVYKGIIVSVV